MNEGILYVGDRIKIGPSRNGNYQEGRVCSIRRNKQPIFSILPGEAASVAVSFDSVDENTVIRRGMVMLSENQPATCCWEFEAKFFLIYHPGNEIEVGFQGTGNLLGQKILCNDFNKKRQKKFFWWKGDSNPRPLTRSRKPSRTSCRRGIALESTALDHSAIPPCLIGRFFAVTIKFCSIFF